MPSPFVGKMKSSSPSPPTNRLALLPCLTCLLLVAACATSPLDVSSLEAQDRQQMLAALASSTESWNRGDLTGHLALYDESVTTMAKNGPRPGIEAIERSFREAYFVNGKPKQELGTGQVTIRPLSRDSALMTGRFVLSGGGLHEQSGWFSLVWLRTAAGWRVVHDHTS